jgi:hypothetical protein
MVKIMALPDLRESSRDGHFVDKENWSGRKELLVATALLILGFVFKRKLTRLWRLSMAG